MSTANLKDRKPIASPSPPASISVEEVARRRRECDEANASLRLEGLAMSPAAREIRELWITGQITGDELTARILACKPLE
ncbi:MAG TPA: antitoxin VbhA family protein [Stellaceae bacterium]|nr:antitoxin VbhA family protein [Stellaceae bacterium]